jgi:hypothetical protein
MTYTEIKKAIVSMLREVYPKNPIYGTDITEGYKTPCFFVSINIDYEGGTYNITEKTLYVNITKVQKTANEIDALEFFQSVEDKFYPILRVGDRCLTTSDFQHGFEGDHKNVPYIEFQSNFYDVLTHKDQSETMREIIFKEEHK